MSFVKHVQPLSPKVVQLRKVEAFSEAKCSTEFLALISYDVVEWMRQL
jgi:hypothetical protein